MTCTSAFTLIAIAAALVACSPSTADQTGTAPTAATDRATGPTAQAPSSAPASKAALTSAATGDRVLSLGGLGPLRVGEALPAGGSWAVAGDQAGDGCRAARSKAYPGVYALVEGGTVRRITVRQGSDVTLVEGLGVQSTETDVRTSFPGFRSEPHKYEDAPAKYLTAPKASERESALRFEIGADGKVEAIHVGQMPQLAYVEGCG